MKFILNILYFDVNQNFSILVDCLKIICQN